MNKPGLQRVTTLMRRELQEYRGALVITPIAIAGILTLLMLLSALFANRITVVGEAVIDGLMEEHHGGISINIQIDDDGERVHYGYRIETLDEPANQEDWDFSRDWTFKPPAGEDQTDKAANEAEREASGSLNPVMNIVHGLMLLVLFALTFYYLLGSLYNDRRDRSVLFWKSMPVSEWEEVLAKFGIAMVVAPAVFIAVSIALQLVNTALVMLLVSRMDKDPYEMVLANLDFGRLFFGQISGWFLTALWIAPSYAWLLLASAFARRGPFLTAVAPVLGLVVVEKLFIGSNVVGAAVQRHLPHANELTGTQVGFYTDIPDWGAQDYFGLLLGLLFAAAALAGAVLCRRRRFEL